MPPHDDEYAARTYEDASLEAEDAQNVTATKSSAPGVETGSVLRKSPQMETLSSAGVRQQSLPMDSAAGDIRRLQKTQKVSGSHPRPPEACFPPDHMNDNNQQDWRIDNDRKYMSLYRRIS